MTIATLLRSGSAFLAGCLVLGLSGGARAADCPPFFLHEGRIAEALVIFGGIAGPARDLTSEERAAAERGGIAMGVGAHLRVYAFTVSQPWKGVGAGQRLRVLHDASSGGAFKQGGNLLVVSMKRVGDLYWVRRCGDALPVSAAQLKDNLARLEEIIGIGHHTKILARDRVCTTADDCTAIETDCGGCDCGTPVAKRAADAYREMHRRTCAVLRPIAVCERVCETFVPSCVEGLCR